MQRNRPPMKLLPPERGEGGRRPHTGAVFQASRILPPPERVGGRAAPPYGRRHPGPLRSFPVLPSASARRHPGGCRSRGGAAWEGPILGGDTLRIPHPGVRTLARRGVRPPEGRSSVSGSSCLIKVKTPYVRTILAPREGCARIGIARRAPQLVELQQSPNIVHSPLTR